MKKPVFYVFLILILLAACSSDSDEANDKQSGHLPAPAAQSLTSVTVYLDGSGHSESRAMNKDFAMMSCDYFEVVFLGNNNGVLVPARGQWRIGDKAGVNGVYRTPAGVNYGGVSPAPTPGTGSALLLAGKSDKTLMAIGKLSAATSFITDDTKFVTFEVAAFETGVNTNLNLSSFLTAAGGSPTSDPNNVSVSNTNTDSEVIKNVSFFVFMLESANTDIRAKYEFKLNSGSFSSYTDGLLVAAKGTVEKKHPSYTMLDGSNIGDEFIIVNEKTTVTMTNNQTADIGSPFKPAVTFKFDTSGTIAGSIFALVFEIPVYALVQDCRWYIRPGYGVLHYELDDGRGGMGGAVLIKTGQASVPVMSGEFKIKILQVPAKWRYRYPSDPADSNRAFSYTGLQVQLQDIHGEPKTNDPRVQTPNSIIPNTLLSFKIGGVSVSSGYQLPDIFYGLIEVTVIYTDTQSYLSAEDKFYILASSNYTTTMKFDYANLTTMNSRIIDVNNTTQWQTLFNLTNNLNHITIIRLGGSFNIAATTLQTSSVPNIDGGLFMIVASAPNVILGRGGSGYRIDIASDNSGLVAFYFGKWPFDGLSGSPVLLNTTNALPDGPHPTYPFTVHAGGTTADPNVFSTKMITDQKTFQDNSVGGGIYNVDLDEKLYDITPPLANVRTFVKGVNVIPENLLH